MITSSLAAALLALACSDRLPTRALLPEAQALQSGDSVPQLRMTIQPRTIHLNMATINVVLFSTADFDAASVDADSVRLHVGPQAEGIGPVQRNGRAITSLRDYDGDGRLDRMISFRTADLVAAGLGGCAVTLSLQGHGSRRFVATDPSPPQILGGAEPQSLHIEPDTLALRVHRTEQLMARATGANGEPMLCDAQWSSADSTIASVSPQGEVRGRRAGRTQVTARVLELSASAEVKVQGAEIGMLPPEHGPPSEYYEEHNLVYDDHRMGGPFPRNLIVVLFQTGATLTERQEALALINGEVVGGSRHGTSGTYYIRVEDHGTADPLFAAIAKLETLPQVAVAIPDILINIDIHYLRPNDGPGWKKEDWQVVPNRATGPRWGHEAVAAPLAWGCETGQQAVRIAVVDLSTQASPHHPIHVASIIRSTANDSTGMAGMLWNGSFLVSDASVGNPKASSEEILNNFRTHLENAFKARARIINLSWGFGHRDAAGQPMKPSLKVKLDVDRARAFARYFEQVFRDWEAKYQHQPLYVIGAGNNGVDASLAGLPQLAAPTSPLSSRAIVVGASTVTWKVQDKERNIWTTSDEVFGGSNFGSLVQVTAPGDAVTVEDASGVTSQRSGTSLAAPYVTAVAGLLLSTDSTLKADSVKSLLIAGAVRGKHTAGGIPHLNAYESLKLAAERPGAPLCGNRIWGFDGVVTVQRGTGSTVVEENIITTGGTITQVNPMHGGKQVRVQVRPAFGSAQIHTYNFHNGSWMHAGSDHVWAPPGSSGSLHSIYESTHDGDQWVVVGRASETETEYVHQLDLWTAGSVSLDTLAHVTVPQYAPPHQLFCSRRFLRVIQAARTSYGREEWERRQRSWQDGCILASAARYRYRVPVHPRYSSAMSPLGDRFLLVVNYEEGSVRHLGYRILESKTYVGDPDGYKGIFGDSVIYEAEHHTHHHDKWHGGTEVYAVSLKDGTSERIARLSRAETYNLHGTSVSEDGREWSVQVRRWWNRNNGDDYLAQCWTEYQDLHTGAVLHAIPRCAQFPTAMIAPSVIGGADPVQPSRGSRSVSTRQTHEHSGWRAVFEPHQ
jgi:hypothetical protein